MSKYGHPVHDRGLLKEPSPMTHVERIVAPLLVVHGELDANVPIGEAQPARRRIGGTRSGRAVPPARR